uniref:Uncharacterized protein n=1 Tax=Phenylobacterium glaciei TaxID=2803784 RepID=A0A974P6V6_9CAUL|nr:hypothetical protein JKL49_23895 [Phenylobacterium glaciei]
MTHADRFIWGPPPASCGRCTSGSTARPLLEVIATRALLMALPFGLWFLWREIARRTGREMGSTPWAWLFAAGAVLLGFR